MCWDSESDHRWGRYDCLQSRAKCPARLHLKQCALGGPDGAGVWYDWVLAEESREWD